jgi:hypothetical protein
MCRVLDHSSIRKRLLKGLTDRKTRYRVDAITAVIDVGLCCALSVSSIRIPCGFYLAREILIRHSVKRLHCLSATHLSAVSRSITVYDYSSVPGFKLHFSALLDAAAVGKKAKKGKAIPITGREGPQRSETSRLTYILQTIVSQMAVRLSALRAGRSLLHRKILVFISVRG